MTAVRAPYCSDAWRMPGSQQNPFATVNCALERAIDGNPRPVEAMAVQVENPVGFDLSGSKPAIPAAIERRRLEIFSPFWR